LQKIITFISKINLEIGLAYLIIALVLLIVAHLKIPLRKPKQSKINGRNLPTVRAEENKPDLSFDKNYTPSKKIEIQPTAPDLKPQPINRRRLIQ
jgi:hypothetical protein